MIVDLSAGTAGIIEFENGPRYWCMCVERVGDYYKVRIESGWYRHYEWTGNPHPEYLKKWPTRRIIEFIPCSYDDPRARGLPTEITP